MAQLTTHAARESNEKDLPPVADARLCIPTGLLIDDKAQLVSMLEKTQRPPMFENTNDLHGRWTNWSVPQVFKAGASKFPGEPGPSRRPQPASVDAKGALVRISSPLLWCIRGMRRTVCRALSFTHFRSRLVPLDSWAEAGLRRRLLVSAKGLPGDPARASPASQPPTSSRAS